METKQFQVLKCERTDVVAELYDVKYVVVKLHIQLPGGLRKTESGRIQYVHPVPYWDNLYVLEATAPDPEWVEYDIEPCETISGGYKFRDYEVILSDWVNDEGKNVISRYLKPKKV